MWKGYTKSLGFSRMGIDYVKEKTEKIFLYIMKGQNPNLIIQGTEVLFVELGQQLRFSGNCCISSPLTKKQHFLTALLWNSYLHCYL